MTDQHSESERLLYQDGYDDGAAAERAKYPELQAHWDGCAGAEATINDLRARCAELEAGTKHLAEQLTQALVGMGEARRVARVLAGERTQEGHAGWREWQAAKATALAYPEQKPEPREPSEELTRL